MSFELNASVRFTPKKGWTPERIKGAWIIANVSQIIMAEIMADAIRKGRDPGGRAFGKYTDRESRSGYRVPSDFPGAPAGGRAIKSGPQKGWLRYDTRAEFERRAGRNPNAKKMILSGAMWQSMTIAIKSEIKSRIYFRASSAARDGGKTANRTKARIVARQHGADIMGVSDRALHEVQKFLASSVGPFIFEDTLSKAARRKPRKTQARTDSRLRSTLGLLRSLSLINHAQQTIQGRGGRAALRLPTT